jgi:hypothetical protein
MAKSRRNKFRKTKTMRRRSRRNMRGGAYTQEQTQQLLDAGFTPDFLQIVDRARVGFDMLLNNYQGSNLTAEEYMEQTYRDLDMNPDEGFTDTENEEDDDQYGGKKKTRKHKNRKNKSHKNSKNKRGGALFGRGYGANCNDPNYNIYNTNMLKLFPYSAK